MNIGEIIARNTLEGYKQINPHAPDKTIQKIQNGLYQLYGKGEQLVFLNYIYKETNSIYLKHKSTCKQTNCAKESGYEKIKYFLSSEMRNLDVIVDDKNYTEEELNKVYTVLEDIKASIEHLKMGNEIIYNDLIKEIEELKNLTYLGKKNFSTMLIGKITELTLGAYVSKISTDIIEKYNLIDVRNILE